MLSTTGYPFYLLSKWRTALDLLFARLLPAQHPEERDLSEKTVIVTGSNVGIGLEAARALSEMGATVVLACRSRRKGEAARKDILAGYPSARVEVQILNCKDLNSVRSFAKSWGTRPLDILINNAGMIARRYSKSPQGFEHTYTINILSHYLLTMSLLPSMQNGARIVNVSSLASYDVPEQFDPMDLDGSKALEGKLGFKPNRPLSATEIMKLYSRSKLLQVFFTREMQVRLDESLTYAQKSITAHCYHPGLVKTMIWERKDTFITSSQSSIDAAVNSLGVCSKEGAATAVHLSVSDDALKRPGFYWHRMDLRGASRFVEDHKTRAAVWDQMALEAELPTEWRL